MICIVGLGNPGKEYAETRHNVGWIVLDVLTIKNGFSKKMEMGKYASECMQGTLYEKACVVLFPTTFMNNSGTAVRKYMKEAGEPEMLIVLHDEIDIPFGEVKISYDRGAGGHNGVKSLIDAVGSKFVRIRIGVGQKNIFGMMKRPKGDALSNFVLGTFKSSEKKEFSATVEKVERALELLLTKGLETAMQEINRE